MNKDKKKARPAGSAAERATKENHQTSGISQDNFSIYTGPVSRYLLRGQENAVSLRYLEKMLNHSGREVRRIIERERRSGVPILADNITGYYLPADERERAACVRSMRHRAGEIMRTAQAIEEAEGID